LRPRHRDALVVGDDLQQLLDELSARTRSSPAVSD
jgi:hypothetical protein